MAERDVHEEFSDGPAVDVERLIRVALRAGLHYQEAPRSDQWTKWMLGACGALGVAGIIGIISSQSSVTAKLAAIEANQQTQAAQQNRMQNQIDGLITELRK